MTLVLYLGMDLEIEGMQLALILLGIAHDLEHLYLDRLE